MINNEKIKPIEILLVEDNPGDVRLTQIGFRNAKVLNNLHVVMDGVEAMEFLHRAGRYAASPKPDLVLLDFNLPKKNGREVLSEIKTDEQLKSIPVIVLTISNDEEDILKAYNLHANAYITKPIDLNKFMNVIHSLEDFWLTVVKLPPKG